MNQIYKSRFFLTALIVLSTILLIIQKTYTVSKEKSNTVNVYSYNADGLYVFQKLSEKINPNKIKINKKAFIEEIDNDAFSTLMILSPKVGVSERESIIIRKFVEQGGNIILSVVDEKEQMKFANLFLTLEIGTDIVENEKFVNKEIVKVNSRNLDSVLNYGDTYAFYSRLMFESGDYYKSLKIGKGRVFLMLGLPLFSNSLISLEDNRSSAFKILEHKGKIIIDEYRHFYTERTYTELFLEPAFSLPLLGMFLLIICFLFFSKDDYQSDKKMDDNFDAKGYHSLNSQLTLGLWKSENLLKQAVIDQGAKVIKLFPHKKEEVQEALEELKINSPRVVSGRLIEIHKNAFEEKGLKIGIG